MFIDLMLKLNNAKFQDQGHLNEQITWLIKGSMNFYVGDNQKKLLNKPVNLETIKQIKEINHLPLIKQSRLSVMPIDFKSWKVIYKMSRV